MKLMPHSRAAPRIASTSGWVKSWPHSPPNCHVPTPTTETFNPVRPSVRYCILEERVVFSVGEPADQEGQLNGVIIAPHAGLAARDLAARRDVIPAVGPVIYAVQQQSLVFPVGGEIRLGEQGIGD